MLITGRLILRRWRDADIAPFAAIHADPEVAQWLGAPPATPDLAQDYIARIEAHIDNHAFGFWAVERRDDGALIGMCGLRRIDLPEHPLLSCVEIGWRQARHAWGSGLMTEAGRAVLNDGFIRHGLDEVVSFTAEHNQRSRRVMDRLGLRRESARDFDHPALPHGHPLRRHIVYTLGARGWMQHLATSVRCA